MNPETKPFFQDKTLRRRLVKRLGVLAAGIESADRELVAMFIESRDAKQDFDKRNHLANMMACHLELISPLSEDEARHMAQQTGVIVNLANVKSQIKRVEDM